MIDFEEVKGKIRGPSVLMMAPFKDNYELKIEALKENIRFIMDGGINNGKGHIICPCGTGEYVTLSPEETKMMVEAAVEVTGNELLVVAGVQSCDYRVVIKLANIAAEAGAKCVMIPPPYYHPISQESVYRWYKLIAEEIKIGIMCYGQPWRNIGIDFSVSLMSRLAKIENIIAMKYQCAVTDLMGDYIEVLNRYSKRFAFIDNSRTHTTTVAHMHGAAGYITAPGAFWPEFEVKFWSLLEQHKYQEADKWRTKLSPFFGFQRSEDAAGIGGGARYFKATLEYVGLYGGPVRPPFVDLTKEQKRKLFSILEAAGFPKKR